MHFPLVMQKHHYFCVRFPDSEESMQRQVNIHLLNRSTDISGGSWPADRLPWAYPQQIPVGASRQDVHLTPLVLWPCI